MKIPDLPSREKLLAGLTPRECHPALAKAEAAVTEAERELERKRHDLANHELIVGEMPRRAMRGEVRANAVGEALRARDAAALELAAAESALTERRVAVERAQKAAKLAVEREIDRRVEQLERVVGDLGPVLDEVNALGQALLAVRSGQVGGFIRTLSWPCCGACDGARRQANMASAWTAELAFNRERKE